MNSPNGACRLLSSRTRVQSIATPAVASVGCEPRRGFAMIAVLWMLISLASIAAGVALVARLSVGAARNRMSFVRMFWSAEGCAAIIESALHDQFITDSVDAIQRARTEESDHRTTWTNVDGIIRDVARQLPRQCTVRATAGGSVININAVDAPTLQRLFALLHIPPSQSDSLIDALMDWRDPDEDVRRFGAEREWYDHAGRPAPRNAAFMSPDELRNVRGFENFAGLDSLFGVDTERIAFWQAPLVVVASLPGINDEAIGLAARLRASHRRLPDLLDFANQLSPATREVFANHYGEIRRLATTDPDSWTITVRALSPGAEVGVAITTRLERRGADVTFTGWEVEWLHAAAAVGQKVFAGGV